MARRRALLAWGVAVALAVAGAVILIAGLLTPVAFGWFAYQPLAHATFAPASAGVFLSPTTIVGMVVLAFGLVALAFLAGRRAGAKRRS
ncbi:MULTISPECIES: hypothetical protein [Microbacterium]|uniref:Uncharacterized protein n=1 Tax=Microbacterium trichothecenolyticum TaxID=69370 RepID=A0A0M2HKY1_MICTR|nr:MULTISPECIES: hypothetical protein [Microbacterium]KJL45056.1 hypothetical protein RS82_00405 [Microbacterium trichothecenolyticum]MDR7191275.1 heme/copper-type cytochrome/quinol oxidase subunit 1 [Microbacterium sp. BE35]